MKGLGGHVSPLLERRAQVRRAQRDHMPDALGPAAPALGGLVTGAARHQTAHRVTDKRDLLHLHRPRPHQLLEERRNGQTVLRDVQPGVVAQIYGGATEIPGQARTVGIARRSATPIPIELIPHQAMQEHDQPRRGIRERRAHRARV